MGLANNWRSLLGIGLVAGAMLAASPGCKASKKTTVSSEAFLAPQLSGTTTGVRVVVDKLTILRESHRKPDGSTDFDGTLLAGTPPLITVVGKLDEDRLLVFDSDTKTLLTLDVVRGTVVKVFTRDEFLGLFRGTVTKPAIGPVVKLRNGWLLAFEKSSKSLFAVHSDPDGGPGIVATVVLDQSEMQSQIFPPPLTKTQVLIGSLLEFTPDHALMVPANNITALHHLELEDNVQTLSGRFVLPDGKGLLDFEKIRLKTGNVNIDVKDFPPLPLPGTNRILLFDRARETASFLTLAWRLDQDNVIRASVDVAVNRSELTQAIQGTQRGGEPFAGQFKFTYGVLHQDTTLESGDPSVRTVALAFDATTKNIIGYDWSRPRNSADKVFVFSTATQLSDRTDLNFDPLLDVGTFEPELLFAQNDVVNNRLVFDGGPDEILALNYETGQWVTVGHKRDIGRATGDTLLNINYLEALDPPPDGNGREVLAYDFESASLVAIRLEYLPIPVSR